MAASPAEQGQETHRLEVGNQVEDVGETQDHNQVATEEDHRRDRDPKP